MWDDGAIWQGASEGSLLLKSCGDCGQICHPPLPMCPHCQSVRGAHKAASGKASLVSWLVSQHPGDAAGPHRVVIVVRLEEGVNFVSKLIGAPAATLYEGMPLEVCFEDADGMTLPVFRPAGARA